MQVVSYAARQRLVVRPVEGASVRETIRELLDGDAARYAVFTGLGRVDGVRLAREDQASGVLQLISLHGTLSTSAGQLAIVGRDEHGALVGGELVDARAVELELVVELLQRNADEAEQPVHQNVKPSWAEVAAASMQVKEQVVIEEDDGAEAPTPRPGDVIEHASFGVCTVEKVDDEDFVHVRSTNQRLLRLSLEVLRVELLDETDGHRRYRSRARAASRTR